MTKWSIAVYMGGNNNLSMAADTDIDEILSRGSTDDVKVAVFARRQLAPGVSGPAKRFLVGAAGQAPTMDDLGDVDSGDPRSVLDFAGWAFGAQPADRYALVLWNHGSGFEVQDLDQLYTPAERSALGLTRAELNSRATQPVARLFFSSSVRTILGRSTEQERAILSDDATGHSLDAIELRNVIVGVNKRLGRTLDVLGMDACLMSSIEVIYELRRDVDVIVGSEELEPNAGWPYERILGRLIEDPAMGSDQFGAMVVRQYDESYADQSSQWPVTHAAFRPGAMDGFVSALDHLSSAFEDSLEDWPKVDGAARRSAHLAEAYGFELIDTKSFCAQILASSLPATVRDAAGAVEDLTAPGGFILSERHRGDTVQSCGGLSVYYPTGRRGISPYYGDLALSREHGWDGFLHRLAEARLNTV